MKKILLLTLLMLPVTAALANSAYENLAYALRQQKITDDLRQRCEIPASVTDEQMRQLFLQDKQSNVTILAASKALRSNDMKRYQSQIDQVSCPQPKKP